MMPCEQKWKIQQDSLTKTQRPVRLNDPAPSASMEDGGKESAGREPEVLGDNFTDLVKDIHTWN